MQEAEKLTCALAGPPVEAPEQYADIPGAPAATPAAARKRTKRTIMSTPAEDELSTSAGGSSDGPDSEADTSSEQGISSAKRLTADFVASSGGTYVYTLATLLGSWSLCRSHAPPPQGSLKAVPAACTAFPEPAIPSPRSGSAEEQGSPAKHEAPKRSRAVLTRSKPKPTSRSVVGGAPKSPSSPTTEKVRSDKLDRLLRLVRDDPPSAPAPDDAPPASVAAPPGLIPSASVVTSGNGDGQRDLPRVPPWRRPKETWAAAVVAPPPGL